MAYTIIERNISIIYMYLTQKIKAIFKIFNIMFSGHDEIDYYKRYRLRWLNSSTIVESLHRSVARAILCFLVLICAYLPLTFMAVAQVHFLHCHFITPSILRHTPSSNRWCVRFFRILATSLTVLIVVLYVKQPSPEGVSILYFILFLFIYRYILNTRLYWVCFSVARATTCSRAGCGRALHQPCLLWCICNFFYGVG